MKGEEKMKIRTVNRQKFQSFVLSQNWENTIKAIKKRKTE